MLITKQDLILRMDDLQKLMKKRSYKTLKEEFSILEMFLQNYREYSLEEIIALLRVAFDKNVEAKKNYQFDENWYLIYKGGEASAEAYKTKALYVKAAVFALSISDIPEMKWGYWMDEDGCSVFYFQTAKGQMSFHGWYGVSNFSVPKFEWTWSGIVNKEFPL